MGTKELPNCSIETEIGFTVETKGFKVYTDKKGICVEFDNAKIYEPDQKHVIKTFSDATIIEEISRRYNVDLVINQIKE